MKIETGSEFPSFALLDQDSRLTKLSDFEGAKIVIYFYPKDDTPGCTLEACDFRDSFTEFKDVKVLGVSPDPPKSHLKFIAKHSLNFTLLYDESHSLAEKCGIWVEKVMYGKKYWGVERTTFLIDEKGKVLKVWRKVNAQEHVKELLASI